MQPYAPPMGYGHQGQGGPQNYYAPTQQHGGPGPGGYGTVSYTVGHGEVGHSSFASGKSFANLNSFIGDAQRKVILKSATAWYRCRMLEFSICLAVA